MRGIPARGKTGKNHADIRLCVDAMDMCYSKEHVDTFVIVSGDSDFTPLVAKLKENGKNVIGLGMKDSTSELLANSCDGFIHYADLAKVGAVPPAAPATTGPNARGRAARRANAPVRGATRANREQ